MLEKDKCKHCDFIESLFLDADTSSKREYYIMTEVFVYLHNGKDYCDWVAKKE